MLRGPQAPIAWPSGLPLVSATRRALEQPTAAVPVCYIRNQTGLRRAGPAEQALVRAQPLRERVVGAPQPGRRSPTRARSRSPRGARETPSALRQFANKALEHLSLVGQKAANRWLGASPETEPAFAPERVVPPEADPDPRPRWAQAAQFRADLARRAADREKLERDAGALRDRQRRGAAEGPPPHVGHDKHGNPRAEPPLAAEPQRPAAQGLGNVSRWLLPQPLVAFPVIRGTQRLAEMPPALRPRGLWVRCPVASGSWTGTMRLLGQPEWPAEDGLECVGWEAWDPAECSITQPEWVYILWLHEDEDTPATYVWSHEDLLKEGLALPLSRYEALSLEAAPAPTGTRSMAAPAPAGIEAKGEPKVAFLASPPRGVKRKEVAFEEAPTPRTDRKRIANAENTPATKRSRSRGETVFDPWAPSDEKLSDDCMASVLECVNRLYEPRKATADWPQKVLVVMPPEVRVQRGNKQRGLVAAIDPDRTGTLKASVLNLHSVFDEGEGFKVGRYEASRQTFVPLLTGQIRAGQMAAGEPISQDRSWAKAAASRLRDTHVVKLAQVGKLAAS